MPENYYCLDNFFKKMTDLESPRKNNDCYFYYYSTCAKGDNCTFRHEPSALGCETMCSFWKEGKCLNVHCNFRHMELRKNRKAIQCYWETQPGGCLKQHCPFLHQNPRPNIADDSIESKTDSGTESADNTMSEKLSHINEKSFKSPPVDSLVVNFEEESDNESAPTNSPIKPSHRHVKVKTLEEIKLEKIQAESAAYYSYSEPATVPSEPPQAPPPDSDDLRRRIIDRLSSKTTSSKKRSLEFPANSPKKQKKDETQLQQNISEIKIKTLEEIRAERAKKMEQENDGSQDSAICDSLVTSSTTEITQNSESEAVKRPKKIKLLRKRLAPEEKKNVFDDDEEMAPVVSHNVQNELLNDEENVEMTETAPNNSRSNKTLDEVLLLQDDDDNDNVSLKEEERLLNDIDDLLED